MLAVKSGSGFVVESSRMVIGVVVRNLRMSSSSLLPNDARIRLRFFHAHAHAHASFISTTFGFMNKDSVSVSVSVVGEIK